LLLAQQLLKPASHPRRAVEAHQHRVADQEGGNSRGADAGASADRLQFNQGVGIGLQPMQPQLPWRPRFGALQFIEKGFRVGAVGAALPNKHVQDDPLGGGVDWGAHRGQHQQQADDQGKPCMGLVALALGWHDPVR
jgi:hypothetical protein